MNGFEKQGLKDCVFFNKDELIAHYKDNDDIVKKIKSCNIPDIEPNFIEPIHCYTSVEDILVEEVMAKNFNFTYDNVEKELYADSFEAETIKILLENDD